jgi:hypothetical protein
VIEGVTPVLPKSDAKPEPKVPEPPAVTPPTTLD